MRNVQVGRLSLPDCGAARPRRRRFRSGRHSGVTKVSHHASGPSRRRFLGVELVYEPGERADPSAPGQEVLEAPPTEPAGGGGPGGGDGPGDGSGEEPEPARKRRWRRIASWTSLGVVRMMHAGIGTFVIAYVMIDIPDPNEDVVTETTEVYYADGKHLLGTFAI